MAALATLFHWIVAIPNLRTKFRSLNPCRCHSQFRIPTDGVASLTASNPVVEDETCDTGSGDPHAKAGNLGIPFDPVSLIRGRHFFDEFINDSFPHLLPIFWKLIAA